jgi:hypothetical protein
MLKPDQIFNELAIFISSEIFKAKAIPLNATKALGWRGGIAPTHYQPR